MPHIPQKSPCDALKKLSEVARLDLFSREFATFLDSKDDLAVARKRFVFPLMKTLPYDTVPSDQECIYLCGNSLGLKPKATDKYMMDQLDKWGNMGVELHFEDPLPAAVCDRHGRESMGRLVGADPDCVTLMNALTVNLHLLLVSFYQPTETRYKILIEHGAFPSDRYAVRSQAAVRGYNPDDAIIEIKPRKGEDIIRTEDILQLIEDSGQSIAVVCLSGVQYYTGQKFDMERITMAAQQKGCLVGWDLAHAVGNVMIKLDEWDVDFACWCTYKYLNSGPGCVAGAYVNRRHSKRSAPHFLGWWSNKEETRFQMQDACDVANGIDSFRISNPSPMLIGCVMASLEIFDEFGMERIIEKQFFLTGYLELIVDSVLRSTEARVGTIITPSDVNQRGCQLSLIFNFPLKTVHEQLRKRGVVCDIRLPNVMRITPVPLYNSFTDVYNFGRCLMEVITSCKNQWA